MEWNVDAAASWLKEHVDETLTLIKQEQGDLDRVFLTLRDVAVATADEPSPDDYVAAQALVLYGEGMIAGGEADAELPGATYEIPVGASWICRPAEEGLTIETDRATYTISVQ